MLGLLFPPIDHCVALKQLHTEHGQISYTNKCLSLLPWTRNIYVLFDRSKQLCKRKFPDNKDGVCRRRFTGLSPTDSALWLAERTGSSRESSHQG